MVGLELPGQLKIASREAFNYFLLVKILIGFFLWKFWLFFLVKIWIIFFLWKFFWSGIHFVDERLSWKWEDWKQNEMLKSLLIISLSETMKTSTCLQDLLEEKIKAENHQGRREAPREEKIKVEKHQGRKSREEKTKGGEARCLFRNKAISLKRGLAYISPLRGKENKEKSSRSNNFKQKLNILEDWTLTIWTWTWTFTLSLLHFHFHTI